MPPIRSRHTSSRSSPRNKSAVHVSRTVSRSPGLPPSPLQLAISAEAQQALQEEAEAVTLRNEIETCKALIQKVTNARDSFLKCIDCCLPMSTPYSLTCGHTYCAPCIRKCITAKLEEQLRTRHAPLHLQPPFNNAKLEALFDGHYLFRLPYYCPACCSNIEERPKQHLILRDLASQLFKVIGYPQDYAEKGFATPPNGDIWDGVFPKNMDI